jgi:hypothetical protein
VITAVYLYGAWHGWWEFSPYWLSACVILDVYWISSLYQIVTSGDVAPLINVSMDR